MCLCAALAEAAARLLDATYCAYRRHRSQHAITEPKLNRTLCLKLRRSDANPIVWAGDRSVSGDERM